MGSVFTEFPPPAHWQDFELITLDIARSVWKDDYAERNGRTGQKQKGVDVFGYNRKSNEQSGVQCKKRKRRLKGVEAPSHSLTSAEIDAEFANSKNFSVQLDRFIIATTGELDEDLQDHVRKLNDKKQAPAVSIWFWDYYVEQLNAHPNLMYRYYQNILEYRQKYSEDEHYFRMLAMAFDRPAIRTAVHLENRMRDFVDAIAGLQEAMSTGVLKDREGRTIDQVRIPPKLPAQRKKIQALLQKTRDTATEGIQKGAITDSGYGVEVREPYADTLNQLRRDAVALLNPLLKDRGIAEIDFVEY